MPGAKCRRPGCTKVAGERLPKGATKALPARPAVSRPNPTRPVPPRPGAPRLAPVAQPSGLRAAADRLAARRGIVRPPPQVAGDDAGEDTDELDGEAKLETKPKKRYNLTEWLVPSIPDGMVTVNALAIRGIAKREPWAPCPVWKKRWSDAFDDVTGDLLPNLDIPPGLALVIATAGLAWSMFKDAPKLPPKLAPGLTPAAPAADPAVAPAPPPTPPPVLALVPPDAKDTAWPKPASQAPAASPSSAPSTENSATLPVSPYDSDPRAASAEPVGLASSARNDA